MYFSRYGVNSFEKLMVDFLIYQITKFRLVWSNNLRDGHAAINHNVFVLLFFLLFFFLKRFLSAITIARAI